MNNRRKLVIALGACALAAPLSSFAQSRGKAWRVGFLSMRNRPDSLDTDIRGGPFLRSMRELGYVEGKNLLVEWRFAEGSVERLQDFANDLAQKKVDVIVAEVTTSIHAAQKATTKIPIVMGGASDPVKSGFVRSLAHPGGNITGCSNISEELSPKLLEMLLSMVPGLSRVAVMANLGNTSNVQMLARVQSAAQRTRAKILPFDVRTTAGIEKAFSAMAREKAGALMVPRDSLFIQEARHIAKLAVTNRLPSIGGLREYTEAGGLMSYGPNTEQLYRRVANYVDKILRGATPGNLPVEQPTIFELVINGKTAKALGLTIPLSLLISAENVIE